MPPVRPRALAQDCARVDSYGPARRKPGSEDAKRKQDRRGTDQRRRVARRQTIIKPPTNPEAHRLRIPPVTTPAVTRVNTRPSTSATIPVGGAPSARRMPISIRRREIAYAVTPY